MFFVNFCGFAAVCLSFSSAKICVMLRKKFRNCRLTKRNPPVVAVWANPCYAEGKGGDDHGQHQHPGRPHPGGPQGRRPLSGGPGRAAGGLPAGGQQVGIGRRRAGAGKPHRHEPDLRRHHRRPAGGGADRGGPRPGRARPAGGTRGRRRTGGHHPLPRRGADGARAGGGGGHRGKVSGGGPAPVEPEAENRRGRSGMPFGAGTGTGGKSADCPGQANGRSPVPDGRCPKPGQPAAVRSHRPGYRSNQ